MSHSSASGNASTDATRALLEDIEALPEDESKATASTRIEGTLSRPGLFRGAPDPEGDDHSKSDRRDEADRDNSMAWARSKLLRRDDAAKLIPFTPEEFPGLSTQVDLTSHPAFLRDSETTAYLKHSSHVRYTPVRVGERCRRRERTQCFG